jgi:hypothetical protein
MLSCNQFELNLQGKHNLRRLSSMKSIQLLPSNYIFMGNICWESGAFRPARVCGSYPKLAVVRVISKLKCKFYSKAQNYAIEKCSFYFCVNIDCQWQCYSVIRYRSSHITWHSLLRGFGF